MAGCAVPFILLAAGGLAYFIVSVLARLRTIETKVAEIESVIDSVSLAARASEAASRRLGALEVRVSRLSDAVRAPSPGPAPAGAAAPAVPVTDVPAPTGSLETTSRPPAVAPGPPAVLEHVGQSDTPLPRVKEPEHVVPAQPPLAPEEAREPEAPASPEPQGADRVPAAAMGIVLPPPPQERPADRVPAAALKVAPPAAGGWGDGLRAGLAGEEWEAVVGGSWLNKIGVGVLVIGVALLLGYSFARMGPAGRVSLGVAISLSMLLVGVWVERRERYVVFARGLIGGGWAALYFTAYAMHGLDAARVLDSAIAGTVLLAAVAVGMIGHSLRYRSQVVTGMAYFLAFVALSLGGAPGFSLVALVPLAASLLVITRRFSWAPMMLAGVGLTYGTYLAAASGAPEPTLADFVRGESVLAVYWLLFEAFDVFELARGRTSRFTAAISPVNAFAFLGISMLQWEAMTPDTVYLLFAVTGAMYTASAIARAWLRPPSSFGDDSTVVNRSLAGGYELTVTLATLLLAWASMKRFDGLRLALALLMEAELLFIVGRSLGQRYLRLLGTLLMLKPLAQIVLVALSSETVIATLGLTMPEWAPLASLLALACYANRASLRGREPLGVERAYNGVASAIVLAVAFELAAHHWLAVAWFGVAVVFHEVGARTRAGEFRLHAYVTVALSLAALFATNIVTDPPRQWTVPTIVGALCYALALRQVYGTQLAPERERGDARIAFAIPGSLLAAIVCWIVVPERELGLAWIALALLLHEVGARTFAGDFRVHSYIGAALGLWRVFAANILTEPPLQWVVPALAGALAYAFALRQVYGRHRAPAVEREGARTAMAIPGSLLAAAVCWMVFPEQQLGPWWIALSLAFYEVAARTRGADVRFHAYAASAAGFGWIAANNLLPGPGGGWLVGSGLV